MISFQYDKVVKLEVLLLSNHLFVYLKSGNTKL